MSQDEPGDDHVEIVTLPHIVDSEVVSTVAVPFAPQEGIRVDTLETAPARLNQAFPVRGLVVGLSVVAIVALTVLGHVDQSAGIAVSTALLGTLTMSYGLRPSRHAK